MDFIWKDFWRNYRNIEFVAEKDLFFQVGKTINGEPISNEMFQWMVQDIVDALQLRNDDGFMEMCCGNGLLTKPLSHFVKEVFAFDFTSHLIDTAKKMNANDNVIYQVGDAKEDFFANFQGIEIPKKYLMNDSLGYFTPIDLEEIFARLIAKSDSFDFYITGIPNDELKWNFYNTDERKAIYQECVQSGDITNKGMGKWWKYEELLVISEKFQMEFKLVHQPEHISNFRSNVLFRKYND